MTKSATTATISGDYYPSCKVKLSIRLDEIGDETLTQSTLQNKTTKNLNGAQVPRTGQANASTAQTPGTPSISSVPILDTTAPPGVRRYVLVPPGYDPTLSGPQDSESSDDGLTSDFETIPKEAEWCLNGLRSAATLRVSFRYVDCPIDPRLVRACGVDFFLGCVKDSDFALGIQGAQRSANAGQGNNAEPLTLIPDTYTDDDGNPRTNLRFRGWVDTWTIDWSEAAEPMVRLECRDNTQPLLEQECPPRLCLNGGMPVDQAVALYLSNFYQFTGMTVEYQPNNVDPPKLSDVLSDTALRPNLGPPPAKGGGGEQKLSVLDYLTDIFGSIGHIVRVDGMTLILSTARTYTTSAITRRSDDPYTGRVVDGVQFPYRALIYGRNVEEMRIERNFAQHAPTNIECVSFNTANKTKLVARFPLPEDRIAYAIPGNSKPDQKWKVVTVEGVTDMATLRAVAQSWYEQIGRNEIALEVRTHNMASFGGGNLDPDILDMKVGDTFTLLLDQSQEQQEVNTITAMEGQLSTLQKNSAYMQNLGFSQAFAQQYAQKYTDANFITDYRLKELRVSWDSSEGVQLTLNGVNYIEVRADKNLPQGEEPGTQPTTSNARGTVDQGGSLNNTNPSIGQAPPGAP